MIKKAKRPLKRIAKTKESEKLADSIIKGMQEKKGQEIMSIDIRKFKNAITDFFVICHAESRPHVMAIADSVEEIVFIKSGENPAHKEGRENAEWILLDYTNVVVHIFNKEAREFYGVERLWADANIRTVAVNY
ncbi:MAG: ribosome silencing factor [Bacteroidia bacterium]|nr:ribosome silencing factor [Bacteroidia bacterium]